MKYLVFFALVAVASAAQLTGHEPVPIVRQTSDVREDGSFDSSFETGNGIVVEQNGILKNPGSENEAQQISGRAAWTSPEGEKVEISYIADENGYQPQGSHLPQPQEIPEAILRALKYIAEHPQPEEKKAILG